MAAYGWAKYATVDWKSINAPHAMRAPIKNLRELLSDETLADTNTQNRFEAWARGDNRDIRFEADTRIASEMKRGFVPDYNDLDLHDIWNEAKSWEEKGRPDAAEGIYRGLTESLGVHICSIDDSCGTFWPLFEECIEDIRRCIKQQNISTEDRQMRIEYYASWSLVAFTDFMEYYEKLLAELCTSVEDLNVWKRELEDELQSDDINDRDCYWSVNKKQIEGVLTRVSSIITKMEKNEKVS